MSPFGTFTIVLIILYIVYYAVLISRDLYGKKHTVRSEEEEFDISSLREEEEAVGVEESENGFLLNSSRSENKTVNTTSPAVSDVTPFVPSIPSGIPAASTPAEPASTSGGGTSVAQKKIEKLEEEMEQIEPVGNLTMSKEFFRDLLLQANKEGSLFVQKTPVSAI